MRNVWRRGDNVDLSWRERVRQRPIPYRRSRLFRRNDTARRTSCPVARLLSAGPARKLLFRPEATHPQTNSARRIFSTSGSRGPSRRRSVRRDSRRRWIHSGTVSIPAAYRQRSRPRDNYPVPNRSQPSQSAANESLYDRDRLRPGGIAGRVLGASEASIPVPNALHPEHRQSSKSGWSAAGPDCCSHL